MAFHGSWLIETGDTASCSIPFLTDNPRPTIKPEDLKTISHILISHGHFDHVADAAAIANRNDATIVAHLRNRAVVRQQHSVESTVGMNLGGAIELAVRDRQNGAGAAQQRLPDGIATAAIPLGFC